MQNKFRLLLLWAAVLGLGATPSVMRAGYKPGPGWPEVIMPVFQAVSPVDAGERVYSWRQRANHVVRRYRDTGSMRPLLVGPGILLAMETCQPSTPIVPGMLVQFDRGDYPAVLHYVAAVSADGKSFYITGVNCRRSDGWFDRKRVAFVVREVIAPPPSITTAALAAK